MTKKQAATPAKKKNGRKHGVWSRPLNASVRPQNAETLRKWREGVEPSMTREELHHEMAKYIHPPSLSTIRKWEANLSELTLCYLQAMERVKPGLIRMLFS